MKWLYPLFAVFLLVLTGQSQTNVISVNVADYGLIPKATQVTLTLISPNPRTYNNILISQAPISITTSSNGVGYFTNIIWGQYRADINAIPVTKFLFVVNTNSTGSISLASLVSNPQPLPPNPATNYYTQAQIDSIIQGITAGVGLTNAMATNVAGVIVSNGVAFISTNYASVSYVSNLVNGVSNFSSIIVTNDINRGDASDTGKSLNISLGGSGALSPSSGGNGGSVNIGNGVSGIGLTGTGGNGGSVTIAQGGAGGPFAASGGNGGTVNIANASGIGVGGTVNIATNGATLVGNLTVKSNQTVLGSIYLSNKLGIGNENPQSGLDISSKIANSIATLDINQNLGNFTGNGINLEADANESGAGGQVVIKGGTGGNGGQPAQITVSGSGNLGETGTVAVMGSLSGSGSLSLAGNLYVTNHAYDASGSLLDPEGNEYVTATFVRSVLNNGAFLYGTTNTTGVGFSNIVNGATNSVSLQFGPNAPAAYIKGFTNFVTGTYTNGPYFASIISTNTYQAINGPFVNDFYIAAGGASPEISITPDIFVTYNKTNLIPICEGSGQALIADGTTNLYTWIQSAAQYNSTNSVGFYVVRRVRVVSQGGNNLYINVFGGNGYATSMSFNTPVTVNANYSGTFTGNGAGLTNIYATNITGLGTAAYSNATAFAASTVTNLTAAQISTISAAITNAPSALLWTNRNGIYGNGVGLTNIYATNLVGLGTAAYSNATAFALSAVTNLTAGQIATISASLTNAPATLLWTNGNGIYGNGVGLTNIPVAGLKTLPLTNAPVAFIWTNWSGIYGNGIGLTNLFPTNLVFNSTTQTTAVLNFNVSEIAITNNITFTYATNVASTGFAKYVGATVWGTGITVTWPQLWSPNNTNSVVLTNGVIAFKCFGTNVFAAPYQP